MRTIISYIFLILVFTAGLILFSVSSVYAGKDEDQTQALMQIFTDVLDDQAQRLARAQNPATLTQQGPIHIERTGAYYAITLPQIYITDAQGQSVRLGMISINASSAENPGEWAMTLAIPMPVLIISPKGQEYMRLTFGSQKTAGIWNEKFKAFTKLDATYKDILAIETENNGRISIPDLLVRYDMDILGDGDWSGPFFLRMRGANWDFPNEKLKGEIANINALLTFDQISHGMLRNIINQPLQTLSLYNPQLWSAAKGMKSEFTVSGLNIQTPTTGFETQTTKLKEAFIDIAIDQDTTTANTNIKTKGKFEGLAVTGGAPEFADLIPAQGTLNILQKNIPAQTLSKVLSAEGMNAPLAFLKVPAILAQSKSTIESEGTSISNETYNLKLTGIVLADVTALLSATAQGRLSFEGLERVLSIAKVNSSSARPSAYTGFFQSLTRTLERMKSLARIETTNSGQSFIHLYDFKLDEAGAFTINDKNASAIFLETLNFNSAP